jgi:MFS family permease
MTGEERILDTTTGGTTIRDTTPRDNTIRDNTIRDTTIRQPATCESASSAVAASRVRYEVLGMSFLMAFLMYMERGAIGAAAPSIMREFHVDKITMGWAISAFSWSYALCQMPGGWMADRFGPRVVLAVAMAWWSIFTAATALSFNAISLAATRLLFGAGEAAAFPAGSRALVPWLPLKRRAFGQGFQHSGARLGAALAPAVVVYLIAASGWRTVFYIFGAVGIAWAIGWYALYRNTPGEHPRVGAAELALLPAAQNAARSALKRAVPWRRILRDRNLWHLSTVYFCYGFVIWLYLAWFPTPFCGTQGRSGQPAAVCGHCDEYRRRSIVRSVGFQMGGFAARPDHRLPRRFLDRRLRSAAGCAGEPRNGGAGLPYRSAGRS